MALVDLDTYNFNTGDNITSTLQTIFSSDGPSLQIRLPSTSIQLLVDELAFDCTNGTFQILQGAGSTSSLKCTGPTMFVLTNPNVFEIGSGVQIHGDLVAHPTDTGGDGTIKIDYTSKTDISGSLTCNGDFYNTTEFGLNVVGKTLGQTTGRVLNCNINSLFDDSGCRLNSGIEHCNVTAICTDPDVLGERHEGGDITPSFIERRGLWCQRMKTLTMVYRGEYGWTRWFHQGNERVTATITGYKIGYDTLDNKLAVSVVDPSNLKTYGFQMQIGKCDTLNSSATGIDETSYNYTVIDEDDTCSDLIRGILVESTPGPTNYVNVDINAQNLTANLYVVNAQGSTECYNHTITGVCNLVQLGPDATATDLVCTDMNILEDYDATGNGESYRPVTLCNVTVTNAIHVINNNRTVNVIEKNSSVTYIADVPGNLEVVVLVTRYVNTDSTSGGDGTTNNITGANRAYPTLAAWETAEGVDLIAADEQHLVLCSSPSLIDDSTVFTLNGFVTDATHDIVIQQNDGNYKRATTGSSIVIQENYVTLDGLLFKITGTTGSARCIYITLTGPNNLIKILNCDMEGVLSGTANAFAGIQNLDTSTNIVRHNNTIRNFTGGSGGHFGIYDSGNPTTDETYNNTVYNCDTCYSPNINSNMINNVAEIASGGVGFASSSGTQDYNMSDDASANGANSINSATLSYTDATNGDFTLTASNGQGIGPSADSNVPATDKAGATRIGTVTDIGAYLFIAPESSGGDVISPALSDVITPVISSVI